MLPAQYDPSLDPHIIAYVNAHTDRKTAADLKTAELTQNKTQAEIDKDNKATADNWDQQAQTIASTAGSQQELDAKRQWLKSRGAPPHALALIPATWSQQGMQQMARTGMSLAERAADDRAAATLAEQKKRDQQTAANEAAQRGMQAQELNLSRQRNLIETAKADPFGALGLNKNAPGAAPANGAPGVPAAQLHGTEFLATLPPAVANDVQALADGRREMSQREPASPTGQFKLAALEQYDPEVEPAARPGTQGVYHRSRQRAQHREPEHGPGTPCRARRCRNGAA